MCKNCNALYTASESRRQNPPDRTDLPFSFFTFDLVEDPEQAYDNLVCTFCKLLDKHAPLKTKVLRGNSAPFMTRELKKGIYTRTRLKKRYNKNHKKEIK